MLINTITGCFAHGGLLNQFGGAVFKVLTSVISATSAETHVLG